MTKSNKDGPPLPKAVYSFHPKKRFPGDPTNQYLLELPTTSKQMPCKAEGLARDIQRSPSELEKVAQGLFRSSFEHLQGWRSHRLSGLNHPPCELNFFLSRQNFPHSNLSLLLLVLLWCPSEKRPAPSSLNTPFGESNTEVRSCPLFSRLNKPRQQPLLIACYHMLVINQTFY